MNFHFSLIKEKNAPKCDAEIVNVSHFHGYNRQLDLQHMAVEQAIQRFQLDIVTQRAKRKDNRTSKLVSGIHKFHIICFTYQPLDQQTQQPLAVRLFFYNFRPSFIFIFEIVMTVLFLYHGAGNHPLNRKSQVQKSPE